MTKLVLSNLSNLQNESTTLSTLNNNNAAMVTALENTVSRDGTSPNTMSGDLDMNSNQILNLPDATTAHEPLTLQQYEASASLSGLAPIGAQYVTLATNAGLSNERVLTAGTGITFTDGGAGGALTVSTAATSAAALTKANDTNVTLTLGGTPTTALLQPASITAGWTGTLAAGRGGFGTDLSASSGVPLFATGTPTFTSTSGTGNFVRVTSPTMVTPTLGVASATSVSVGDDAYDATTWNGSTLVPTKNAVRDKIEAGITTKVVNATYDLTTASGTQDITGFGFNPSAVSLSFSVTSGGGGGFGHASSNGPTQGCSVLTSDSGISWLRQTGQAILYSNTAVSVYQQGVISFITDGIRITWTKNGSPTGTYGITVLGFK